MALLGGAGGVGATTPCWTDGLDAVGDGNACGVPPSVRVVSLSRCRAARVTGLAAISASQFENASNRGTHRDWAGYPELPI